MDVLLPLAGGALIGLSALLLLMSVGKIAGVSSILSNILSYPTFNHLWRYCFLIGLMSGSFLYYQFSPTHFDYSFLNTKLELIIGGILVGFGTRLGSGCTSGHGVCGIPRLSTRSIIAVLVFMLTAMITIFVRRHLL